MKPNNPENQELTEEIIRSYKEAAQMDEFLFGDYDYESDWLGKNTNDVT